MNTKMFILRVSCLIFSEKPPLSLNSKPMGRENNQGFERTNGHGNFGLRRPLTHPEGRHNPDPPCKKDQSQLLIHGSWHPMGELLGGNFKKRKTENKAFLDALQKLLKEPHFLNHISKLAPVHTLRL